MIDGIEREVLCRMIRKYMGDNGVAAKDVAKKLEVSNATVSNWLSGNKPIRESNAAAIRHLCAKQIEEASCSHNATPKNLEEYKMNLFRAFVSAGFDNATLSKIVEVIQGVKF